MFLAIITNTDCSSESKRRRQALVTIVPLAGSKRKSAVIQNHIIKRQFCDPHSANKTKRQSKNVRAEYSKEKELLLLLLLG